MLVNVYLYDKFDLVTNEEVYEKAEGCRSLRPKVLMYSHYRQIPM